MNILIWAGGIVAYLVIGVFVSATAIAFFDEDRSTETVIGMLITWPIVAVCLGFVKLAGIVVFVSEKMKPGKKPEKQEKQITYSSPCKLCDKRNTCLAIDLRETLKMVRCEKYMAIVEAHPDIEFRVSED